MDDFQKVSVNTQNIHVVCNNIDNVYDYSVSMENVHLYIDVITENVYYEMVRTHIEHKCGGSVCIKNIRVYIDINMDVQRELMNRHIECIHDESV